MKHASDKNFHVPEQVETPYVRAKQEWDRRIGSSRVQAKNWRIAALLAGVGHFVMLAIILLLISKQQVIPYIVEIDSIGKVSAISKLSTTPTPNKRSITYFLADIIKNIRTIPADAVVLKDQWHAVYAFLTTKARNKMNAYVAKFNPQERMQHITTAVEIMHVTPVSDTSYQISWQETEYSKEGMVLGNDHYTAFLHIKLIPPEDEQAILTNPLGIFIDDFNWSKELKHSTRGTP